MGLLLAKIESTYGTDPTPAANANVIAVTKQGITWTPNFERMSRMILDGTLEKVSGFNVMPSVSLSFRVEIRGNRTTGSTDTDITSGAIAQAIEIDPLLRACDLAATYTAESTNGARDGYVIYTPTVPAAEGDSVTFYYYTGLKLHKVTGAKGTVKGVMEAGKMGYLDFTFSGILNTPTDASIPASPTWLNTKPALFSSSSSTIASYSPVFRKLEFDLGNQVIRRDDANASGGVKGFIITDRNPKLSIDPESVAEATHPIWGDLINSTSRTITAGIGSSSGNRFQGIFVGESESGAYGDVNGNRITNINYEINRATLDATANGSFQLKFF